MAEVISANKFRDIKEAISKKQSKVQFLTNDLINLKVGEAAKLEFSTAIGKGAYLHLFRNQIASRLGFATQIHSERGSTVVYIERLN